MQSGTSDAVATKIAGFRELVASEPQEDRASARSIILETALRLAAGEGVRAASMRRISGAVDMRTASLYNFFPGGKDELISQAVLVMLGRTFRYVVENLRTFDPPAEQLRSLVFAQARWVSANTQIAGAWDVIMSTDRITPVLTPDVRARVAGLSRSYRDLLVALLDDMHIAGGDAHVMAELIIVICDNVARWESTATTVEAADERAWFLVRRMLDEPSGHLTPRRSKPE